MDADAWQAVGQIAALLLVGSYTGWKARKAEVQTRGTGNGFADEVKDSLARIEKKIDDHVAAHADSDVRNRR